VELDDLRKFILGWVNEWPIDRWWRKKHRIAFNSPKHRIACFIDMRMEFEEELIFRKYEVETKKEGYTYDPGAGSWLKPRKYKKMSTQEIDDTFDKINIREIKEGGGGRITI